VAILAIEKTEALANPGVAALHRRGRNGASAAGAGQGAPCGRPVAMLIADSVQAARNAAERIGVEYRSWWR
jgi:xanthine dehydrogenase molybdopterin-binding subunit B